MSRAISERGQPDGRRRRLWRIIVALLVVLLTGALFIGVLAYRAVARFSQTRPAPESATGLRAVEPGHFRHEAVVAAHPEASRAGARILARGGTAADAAVAVQLVLGLVEPQSSGLGGGGFLLYYDASADQVFAYDGRETAPSAATPALFLDEDGDALSFPEALLGGRSVGVPGILRLLELVHQDHGVLPWRELFQDAIRLATAGFRVTPRLSRLVRLDPVLVTFDEAGEYFYPQGEPLAAGMLRRNAPYARVLERVQEDGARGFYEGAIARDVARAVQQAVRPSLARGIFNVLLSEVGLDPGGDADIPAPGLLTVRDLAHYRALRRRPLCRRYRDYRVCGLPPPSGGGIAILQGLALLERFPLAQMEPLSTGALHLLSEAGRLIDADREAYVGDPDHVSVPTAGLLSDEYLRERSRLLKRKAKLSGVRPGLPPGAAKRRRPTGAAEVPSTTHFTIIDADGDVAAVTSSIEFGFGSHTFVDGFLLNNQLTDFSFSPTVAGSPGVNAVEGNKRPRSSMSPTLVFDAESGHFVGALGSPGGSRIVAYVLQTLVALLDWRLTPQQAVSLPHVVARGATTELEDVGWPTEEFLEAREADLERLGHDVRVGQQNSGLHVLWISDGTLEAGVDPRREGVVLGR